MWSAFRLEALPVITADACWLTLYRHPASCVPCVVCFNKMLPYQRNRRAYAACLSIIKQNAAHGSSLLPALMGAGHSSTAV